MDIFKTPITEKKYIIKDVEFATGKTGKCKMIIQTVYMFKLITDYRFYFTGYRFSRRYF